MTAAILPITLGVAYFTLNQSYSTWQISNNKAEALASARFLIDKMGKDLRQAERPFLEVDTTNNSYILFKANIDSAPGSEMISYSLKPYDSNGEEIVRDVWDPDMSNPLKPVYPNNPTSEQIMAKIVRNNKIPTKIPLFSFFTSNDTTYTGSDITQIRMIRVHVLVKAVTAQNYEAVDVSDDIRLRNF